MSSKQPEANASTSQNDEILDQDGPQTVAQSVNVLIQASMKGQSRGAYTLEEASTILSCIKFLQKNLDKSSS